MPAGYRVVGDASWHAGRDEFAPDVMVYPDSGEHIRLTGTPVLCVEVLSSNRTNDLLVKTVKYALAGVDHYWIVDPEAETMDVLVRDGEHYRLETTLTSEQPADVGFGIASVLVDLKALLA